MLIVLAYRSASALDQLLGGRVSVVILLGVVGEVLAGEEVTLGCTGCVSLGDAG